MKKIVVLILTVSFILMMTVGCSTSNQAQQTGDTGTPTVSEGQSAASQDAGASGSAEAQQASALQPRTKDGPLKIAFIPIAMNTQYQMVINGCKEEIERNGGAEFAELLVQAPTDNASTIEEQANIFENFLQQGVDVIALSTESDEAMLPYIDKAAEMGIPVIMFNMAEISPENQYITSVGFDNFDAMKKIGEWIVNRFGDEDTQVAVLEGFPGVINTMRVEGFKAGIEGHPNIQIVASQPANWQREMGQSVTENILQSNPDIDAVVAGFDEMALGAVAAIKQAGKLGDIVVTGFDNTRDAYDSIVAGELSVTVDTAAKEMGINIVKAAKQFCKDGQPVDRQINSELHVYDADNIDTFDLENYEYVPREPQN